MPQRVREKTQLKLKRFIRNGKEERAKFFEKKEDCVIVNSNK
jgi:hypothetical protein